MFDRFVPSICLHSRCTPSHGFMGLTVPWIVLALRRSTLRVKNVAPFIAVCLTLGVTPLQGRGAERAITAAPAGVCDAVTVYWYTASGGPVADPTASIQEGGVFSGTRFMGTINSGQQIIDPVGNDIGYVSSAQVPGVR